MKYKEDYMLIYDNTKKGFIEDIDKDILIDKVKNNYNRKIGKVSESELRSWQNSLTQMSLTVNDDEIPDNSGIAIEYNIPSTSKRVDFIITGLDNNKKSNIILVELKQWETAEAVKNKDGIVRTFLGGGIRETTHPSYQVWTYSCYIKDFNESIYNQNTKIYPCAYLHNYSLKTNDGLLSSTYNYYVKEAPIFTKGDRQKLRNFIKKYVKYGDNKEAIYRLDSGKIKPSKSLQDVLKSMLKGNQEFLMIDEQKVVYEKALEMANLSYKDNKKRVLIVEGGPGTGKSVIAINLLVDLINKGMLAQYVTKNVAPREVYASKLSGSIKKGRIKNLFKGSGTYTESEKNEIDALIVDEAHRLNEKSGLFKNKGENQIKEIIFSSKFSIFFIDEKQKIHIDDYGNISDIKKYAKEFNAEIDHLELESQFRCSGSDGYISWLDHVLEIKDTANFDGFDDTYDFKIIDNPKELFELINKKNNNNKARIVAGYCWDWDKKSRDDTNHFDIVINDFKKSWNLGNTSTWAIDKESINEIGCIHTSQGLEFEYVGVIIGKDLKYENGEIITDFNERAKTDRSLWGIKSLYKSNPEKANKLADEIIKNTYRTLMSRGQKGCYVYCVDKGLENYLKERLQNI